MKYGLKFDSKLELYCWERLSAANIKFEFQKKILLQEKFVHLDKPIQGIHIIIDFDLGNCFLDTKGMVTDVATIKIKMLKNKMRDKQVYLLKSRDQINKFIINFKEKRL